MQKGYNVRLIPILVLTILLACPQGAQSSIGVDKLPVELMVWMKQCCEKYGVEPEFALAVARVESGNKHFNFRIGEMGPIPYWGPMGIHNCFLSKWPVDDPKENILRGVIALSNSKTYQGKLRRLRKYNKSCDSAYIMAVMQHYQFYKDNHVFKLLEVACAQRIPAAKSGTPCNW